LPFCPNCGKHSETKFCPDCGTRLTTVAPQTAQTPVQNVPQPRQPPYSLPRPKGSIGLGIVAGFLLLILLGYIPIFGALMAGFVAGLITRGAGRGAAAGLIAGIGGAVILSIILLVAGATIVSLLGQAGLAVLLKGSTGGIITLLALGNAVVCLVGGLIGGALRRT